VRGTIWFPLHKRSSIVSTETDFLTPPVRPEGEGFQASPRGTLKKCPWCKKFTFEAVVGESVWVLIAWFPEWTRKTFPLDKSIDEFSVILLSPYSPLLVARLALQPSELFHPRKRKLRVRKSVTLPDDLRVYQSTSSRKTYARVRLYRSLCCMWALAWSYSSFTGLPSAGRLVNGQLLCRNVPPACSGVWFQAYRRQ